MFINKILKQCKLFLFESLEYEQWETYYAYLIFIYGD